LDRHQQIDACQQTNPNGVLGFPAWSGVLLEGTFAPPPDEWGGLKIFGWVELEIFLTYFFA
jgi:hypothetical protein